MNTTNAHLNDYLNPSNMFAQLSLRDLLEAREQYHVQFTRDPNVVATALGRYRIRKEDSWPTNKGEGTVHGTGVRTLENSEVRPYSWPAILVFVKEWASVQELSKSRVGSLPRMVEMKDGRAVPICVIEAPKETKTDVRARSVVYPLNNLGGGNPVIAQVQGRRYAATIACLVSDGHKVYALTNRHVAGDLGEIIYSQLGGKMERIGVSSGKQLTRETFSTLHPSWPGDNVYVNLDVGLIEIDDVDRWTAAVGDKGETMGPLVDLALNNTMALVGCQVRGFGAATGEMLGEVHALFYRYKKLGGFEYVADLLIGPRSGETTPRRGSYPKFGTHPGDSGALWVLDPVESAKKGGSGSAEGAQPLPLAVEWGRNMLYSGGAAEPQSYALATFLSGVCAELGVDPVRDWNLDQDDTWGALGHYAIANRVQVALSARYPKLVELMSNNANIISHDDDTIIAGDFVGLGSSDFVALADVPDFFWKPRIAKQGAARQLEGPNHFADMDQPGPDGKTLLDLCEDPAFIDADKWAAFYDTVVDLLKNEPITPQHRGLLPFRVWQIFDAMVGFAGQGKGPEFVCAAGVLTHYLGDACQPLHISYLHDGDPLRAFEYTFKKGKHEGETETRPLGTGVHSAYEDGMVNAYSEEIMKGLKKTKKATAGEEIATGFDAARKTVEMMREVFRRIPPADIVDAYVAYDGAPKDLPPYLWDKFGDATITAMQDGAHLLAVIWESAWKMGKGEINVGSTDALTQAKAMKICANPEFLPSCTVDQIGALLQHATP